MIYEPKRLLVVVKTYPNPSQSYGETVCCAGVDLTTGRWVRMYPITFRRLVGKQFEKYQVIDCQAAKPTKGDFRPESLRIDQDSITLVGDPMPAGDKGWLRRMALLPEPAQSVEAVQAAQAADGTSLAMIRPKEVKGLVIEKAKPWTAKQKAYLDQEHLNLGVETSQHNRDEVRGEAGVHLAIRPRRGHRAFGCGGRAGGRDRAGRQEKGGTDLQTLIGHMVSGRWESIRPRCQRCRFRRDRRLLRAPTNRPRSRCT